MSKATNKALNEIRPYISAGFAVLAISTVEEDRITKILLEATYTDEDGMKQPYKVLRATAKPVVDECRLVEVDGKDEVSTQTVSIPGGWSGAFTYISSMDDEGHPKSPKTILICHDWQFNMAQPMAIRTLKDCIPGLKKAGSMIVLVAPSFRNLPSELEADVKLLSLPLPSHEELEDALNVSLESTDTTDISPDLKEQMLKAATGLHLQNAEDAFALSYAKTGKNDPMMVADEKMDQVRKSGLLQIYKPEDPKNIGGLANAIEFIQNEVVPSFGTKLSVRRTLFCGFPGSGKSLTAKAFGAFTNTPVLLCSLSKLKGNGHVGDTERLTLQALALAKAVAPAVLWFDEIDKALGDTDSSAHTGSTTGAQMGLLATWLEEEQPNDLVCVMTANRWELIPMEIARRFDEVFFVDLPSSTEREQIAAVHLRLNECKPTEELCKHVAKLSKEWTGDEIRKCILSAARRTKSNITLESLTTAAEMVRPISLTKKDQLDALRAWGRQNIRLANTPEEVSKTGNKRQISKV